MGIPARARRRSELVPRQELTLQKIVRRTLSWRLEQGILVEATSVQSERSDAISCSLTESQFPMISSGPLAPSPADATL